MKLGNCGLHVIKNPPSAAKKYSYVGAIPKVLGYEVKANMSDVMGGRAFKNSDGDVVTIKFPSFDSVNDAHEYANARGVHVVGH